MLNTLITGGDEESEELGELNKVSMALLREWHDADLPGCRPRRNK